MVDEEAVLDRDRGIRKLRRIVNDAPSEASAAGLRIRSRIRAGVCDHKLGAWKRHTEELLLLEIAKKAVVDSEAMDALGELIVEHENAPTPC